MCCVLEPADSTTVPQPIFRAGSLNMSGAKLTQPLGMPLGSWSVLLSARAFKRRDHWKDNSNAGRILNESSRSWLGKLTLPTPEGRAAPTPVSGLVGGSNPSSGTSPNAKKTQQNQWFSLVSVSFRQSFSIPPNLVEYHEFWQPLATEE